MCELGVEVVSVVYNTLLGKDGFGRGRSLGHSHWLAGNGGILNEGFDSAGKSGGVAFGDDDAGVAEDVGDFTGVGADDGDAGVPWLP